MKTLGITFLCITGIGLIFINFRSSSFTQIASGEKLVATFNPNIGLSMCGRGGATFNFDLTGDGSLPVAPKLKGLGEQHFEITTESAEAQEFFNQGMRLVYGFNHAEALRSFQEAARLDPDCAMAYWGQALAVGPNINDPFPDMERQKQAFESINKAAALTGKITEMEKALINAYKARCTDQEIEQQNLNIAYFQEMQKVYESYPDHPETGILYAASIMNTMPWDYYDGEKNPRENTDACVAALRKVIEKYPKHPGGHHYFIHIIEAKDPNQAIPSADVLDDLAPAAGHLIHMPSHIYIGVGMYAEAADNNRRAILADENYIAQCQAQGVYPLAYYPHNLHFLWAAASMLGRSEEAINAAEKVADKVPVSMALDIPFIQDFMAVPLQAYTRFGKWNEILTTPDPGATYLHTSMMWHYARGMAFTRKGDVEKAKDELQQVKKYAADPAAETLLAAYNNPTSNVGKIAIEALAGEIAASEGKTDEALEHLSAAVKHEDALIYQEPAAWHAPTRQYLGALLLENGKAAEAEKIYRKDLEINRDNGWSLFGLSQSLAAQGKSIEAQQTREAFQRAWSLADVALAASRF
ncbi:MAG: hypothetical protein HKN76_16880 [Saprospiraceae bacterium]|nr:hypothetical protein [Saprospiraceae bacterium]